MCKVGRSWGGGIPNLIIKEHHLLVKFVSEEGKEQFVSEMREGEKW